MQKIKNEKGITLIILVITIIILALISIPTTMKIGDIIKLNDLTKFKDDFTIIKESVSQVYPAEESISGIGPIYSYTPPVAEKNQNDGGNYYVIDMNKLNNDLYNKLNSDSNIESLNYGKSNYDVNNITEDLYVINEISRTIYYVAGFEDMEGNTIHRMPESFTQIEVENYI